MLYKDVGNCLTPPEMLSDPPRCPEPPFHTREDLPDTSWFIRVSAKPVRKVSESGPPSSRNVDHSDMRKRAPLCASFLPLNAGLGLFVGGYSTVLTVVHTPYTTLRTMKEGSMVRIYHPEGPWEGEENEHIYHPEDHGRGENGAHLPP